MLQTSLLLMKGLNKTKTPISLFPKAILFMFIYQMRKTAYNEITVASGIPKNKTGVNTLEVLLKAL